MSDETLLPTLPMEDVAAVPKKKSKRWVVVFVVAVVLVAGIVVAVVVALSPKGFTVTGTMTLTDGNNITTSGATGCYGTGGYDDISTAAQVTVRNQAGETVGLAKLERGRSLSGGCVFEFAVEDVTPGSRFYEVEVSHRGSIQYTEEELRSGQVALSLG